MMDKVVKARWETKARELEAERDGLVGLPSAQDRIKNMQERIDKIRDKIKEQNASN